jgi:hypothetical protein
MSSATVFAEANGSSSGLAAHPDAPSRDIASARLGDLGDRIEAAERLASGPSDLMDAAAPIGGRRAGAIDRGDKLNQLAEQVAQLAAADDLDLHRPPEPVPAAEQSRPIAAARTPASTGKGEPPAAEAVPGAKHSPRLAELIKLKRAEIERLGSTPVGWLDSIGQAPPLRPVSADFAGPPAYDPDPLHLKPAAETSFAQPGAAGYTVASAPPTPPPMADEDDRPGRERQSSRLAELRSEGLSNGLYGFGVGLGIALISGAALYVILRLV